MCAGECVSCLGIALRTTLKKFFQSDYYSDYVPIVPFMDVAEPPVTALCILVSAHARHKENTHEHRDWPHTHTNTHILWENKYNTGWNAS